MNNFKTQLREYAFKEPHVYPKLEDFQLNVHYALTLSRDCSKHSSIHETVMEYEDIFNLLRGSQCKFQVRPELSTKSVNLHYHGTILFPTTESIYKFYWATIRILKPLCTFTIKPISEEEPWQWYLYTIKQRHIMKPLLSHNSLLYHIRESSVSLFTPISRKAVARSHKPKQAVGRSEKL